MQLIPLSAEMPQTDEDANRFLIDYIATNDLEKSILCNLFRVYRAQGDTINEALIRIVDRLIKD